MTSILVVCTGNICRSPIAEGMLQNALSARFGAEAPEVSSAGISAIEGAPATPDAVKSAAERGVALGEHRASPLSSERARAADLVIGMASEHREALGHDLAVASRTFTLKELVRLLESSPWPSSSASETGSLADRVAAASEARRAGFRGNPRDEDVADPLGLPLQSYRAIAWELDEWIARLVDGLYGAEAVPAVPGAPAANEA